MKIIINTKDRNDHIDKIASLFGLERRRKDLFVGLLRLYWTEGYFRTTKLALANAYSWAGSYVTVVTGINHFVNIGLLSKSKEDSFLYKFNPSLISNTGITVINIEIRRDTQAESIVDEITVPCTIELPAQLLLDSELYPPKGDYPSYAEPDPRMNPMYINPRYQNLLKKDLIGDDF